MKKLLSLLSVISLVMPISTIIACSDPNAASNN
ncbi:hypothetical protein SGLAD_v1c06780 [Spiroplasma gladiatoris]|uniref:Lipoprotein n=1 Tax=Spiroplasma gladiatoris TaxID=2143 RepID=A0A4P7AI03_9MOLU|nr:hypothetical protein SGLAD_v1c06780 [Spiroplasma gladiatoris]